MTGSLDRGDVHLSQGLMEAGHGTCRWGCSVALFLGQFENKIDKKGRVSVPAPFRSILGAPTGNVAFFFPPDKSPSLEGGGPDRLEKLQERLDQLGEFTPEYQRLQLMFNDAIELPFDPEGRIMLPRKQIERAQIDEIALFVGSGRTFQVWAPANYAAHRERVEQVQNAAANLPPASQGGAAA